MFAYDRLVKILAKAKKQLPESRSERQFPDTRAKKAVVKLKVKKALIIDIWLPI